MPQSFFSRTPIRPVFVQENPTGKTHKFTPGHYIATSGGYDVSTFNTIRDRAANNSKLEGVQVRFGWRDLQGGDNNYTAGTTLIDSLIKQMEDRSKKFVLFVAIKTFGSGRAVPDFMMNSTYSGGDYRYQSGSTQGGPGGYIPRFEDPQVRAKFEDMMQHYATQFNTRAGLEAIIFSEVSHSYPYDEATSEASWSLRETHYRQYAQTVAASKAIWNRTNVTQWMAGPNNPMRDWVVPYLTPAGVGLGMTDMCILDRDFWRHNGDTVNRAIGNIQHCKSQFNANGTPILPVMHHVSAHALQGSCSTRGQNDEAVEAGYIAYRNSPYYNWNATDYKRWPDFNATGYPAGSTQEVKDRWAEHGGTPYFTKRQLYDFGVGYVGATHMFWLHRNQKDRDGSGKSENTVVDEFLASNDPSGKNWATRDTYPSHVTWNVAGSATF